MIRNNPLSALDTFKVMENLVAVKILLATCKRGLLKTT
jgi:hypothetical protein